MKQVKVSASKTVCNFSEPYIIAEIGANHNGDMDMARKMIDAAVECGCDAVKFQSWSPDSLVSREEYDRNQKYNDSAKKHFGSLREMIEKYYLRTEQHYELEAYCREKNVDFCSTPFSNDEADLLEDLKTPFYKVASMDINNLEFLKYLASKGKPVILSTGMSTLGEIEAAINVINKAGNDEIILLHCISIYPPLYEDIHLNNITMLQQTFGYPVGFSDHTIGFSIPLASVALGACVIEKHFTLDKDLPGWDHEISANPEEMKIICEQSRNIVRSMGSFKRIVSAAETAKKDKFRRSAVTRAAMNSGHIVSEQDLDFKRPGTGIQPEEMKYLVGRKVKNDIAEGELLKWEHFE
jgi:sialic acid synthase SpsE